MSGIHPPDARALRMMDMYRQGLTLQQIGDRYDVSRERVRQILRKYGVHPTDGGVAVRAQVRRATQASESERRFQQRHGCSRAEWRALVESGATQAYTYQKRTARMRGIAWRLTLKQWWDIWAASGHWNERGRHAGEFCMARLGDRGPYASGNVYITTCRDNIQECRKRKSPRRSRDLQGVYLVYPGHSKPYVARYGRKGLGMFTSVEDARAARRAYLASLGKAA